MRCVLRYRDLLLTYVESLAFVETTVIFVRASTVRSSDHFRVEPVKPEGKRVASRAALRPSIGCDCLRLVLARACLVKLQHAGAAPRPWVGGLFMLVNASRDRHLRRAQFPRDLLRRRDRVFLVDE